MGRFVRIGVDGPSAADPDALADALADQIRPRGHAAVRVRTSDHLRPASLRLERGRDDPDAFYEDWTDWAGLRREVLDPTGPGGSGRIRPTRFDAVADRATRQDFVTIAAGSVVILSGQFLLGRGLPLDLTLYLDLSVGALQRRTPPGLAWTLPAYLRYADEVDPAALADVVVRYDDPTHPAVAHR
jgi:hypothetical protein